MSKTPTSLPRQNPVFMFLSSEDKHGRGGAVPVFSVPGSTTAEECSGKATILKENLVIPSSSLPTSQRKRGRPQQALIPFRLPTDEEDTQARGENGAGCSSISSCSTYKVPFGETNVLEDGGGSPVRKVWEVKTENLEIIKRLFMMHAEDGEKNVGVGNEEAAQGMHLSKGGAEAEVKAVSGEIMEKCLRWVRFQAPELFWTTIHKCVSKSYDDWKCFETVHAAATLTALKFMTVTEKHIKPGDYVRFYDAQMDCYKMLRHTMTGILLVSDKQKDIPEKVLDELFERFYFIGFKSMMSSRLKARNAGMGGEEMEVDGPEARKVSCSCCFFECACQKISDMFQEANLALQGLGLMDELAGPRLYNVMKCEISSKLAAIGTDMVDASHLQGLLSWLEEHASVWINIIYPVLPPNEEKSVKKQIESDLKLMLLDQYGTLIIKDLFTVIIEYPESQPLLDDLRHCMKEVNLRNNLVASLKSSLERRLLNAGVNTSEVLDAYIATVRALKYVDPSGILVQLVTPPVRKYLKHREETVRVILISLTEESGELSEELARNPTNPDKNNRITMSNWRQWEPDPIDVPKDKHNLRKSDLIEALVSIYGSKSVFIDEYRALLADRLLRLPKPGSITREIKCLELLKLRFGESDLQKCEVMLKDVSDSQRLNTRIYEEDGAVLANEEVHLTGLIVSAQFWPSFKQEELKLPEPVQAALEKYSKAFEMIKGNRTLEWQKHIGTVELEIEHGGSVIPFTVNPIQATIIYHFQEKDSWTLDELSEITGTTTTYLNNRIGFWISKGIIVNAGHGMYTLADSISDSTKPGVMPNKYEEIEVDSPMASTSSQRATELQVFWSYIEAMLTNLESLPLPRIHSMLKLFATVECSSEELQRFLDDKVSQNLLVYSAGQYQLPK